MDHLDALIARNARYAEERFPGPRPIRPAEGLAIVACMDSRMDIFGMLGLDSGDAHVIRNAGGVVTDDVIRSLVISQRLLGTTDIILLHHTECGLQTISEDRLRQELEAETGMRPSFAFESFDDPYADVRQSMARLHNNPFVVHKGTIRGFVYDVATGRLAEVN